MADIAETKESLRLLAVRLEGHPHWDGLKAAYLELVTLMGQIHGAVSECSRRYEGNPEVRRAEQAFDQMKTTVRKVGHDIRLASEPALAMGLQAALQHASETLDWLQKVEP